MVCPLFIKYAPNKTALPFPSGIWSVLQSRASLAITSLSAFSMLIPLFQTIFPGVQAHHVALWGYQT